MPSPPVPSHPVLRRLFVGSAGSTAFLYAVGLTADAVLVGKLLMSRGFADLTALVFAVLPAPFLAAGLFRALRVIVGPGVDMAWAPNPVRQGEPFSFSWWTFGRGEPFDEVRLVLVGEDAVPTKPRVRLSIPFCHPDLIGAYTVYERHRRQLVSARDVRPRSQGSGTAVIPAAPPDAHHQRAPINGWTFRMECFRHGAVVFREKRAVGVTLAADPDPDPPPAS